jgi:hypothetical protein
MVIGNIMTSALPGDATIDPPGHESENTWWTKSAQSEISESRCLIPRSLPTVLSLSAANPRTTTG